MRIESWQHDIVFFFFAALILREGRRIYGRHQANIFLWGSLLWTGIIENVNVALGAYDSFAYANHYSFGGTLIEGYGGWFSWILFVPLAACLGWFLLSFPALLIANELVPNRSTWLKSTVIQRKGFRWLSRVERRLFRTDTLDLTGMDVHRVGRVFYFRLAAYLPAFFLCCFVLAGATTLLWNNRWGPFDNVFPGFGHKAYLVPPEEVSQQLHVPTHRIGRGE